MVSGTKPGANKNFFYDLNNFDDLRPYSIHWVLFK